MEVKYFDILSFLSRNISKSSDKQQCFVSAFVLNTLYDYQLRNSRIFSYIWLDLKDSQLDLYDVQKFLECYCIACENNFVAPEIRISINMIKAYYTLCSGV